MSTASMVRKHLKPLLAHIPDVAAIGRRVMVTPIDHVWRGVVVYSHNHDSYFTAQWGMTHFCNPFGNFPSDWGEQVLRGSQGLRFWSEPLESEHFVQQLEADILPMLREIQTLDDLFDEITIGPAKPFRLRQIPEFLGVTLHSARGDLDAARHDLARLRNGTTLWSQYPYVNATRMVVDALGPLLDADDIPGIVRQLAEWEAIRIAKNKGFEKIWKPTPFPLEALIEKPTPLGTG